MTVQRDDEPLAPPAELAARVRRARRAAALTQRALAKKAGVAVGTVQAIETGQRMPRFASVIAIARALDLPREQLVASSESTPVRSLPEHGAAVDLSPSDLLIARIHHDAPPAWRQRIQQVLIGGDNIVIQVKPVTDEARATLNATLDQLALVDAAAYAQVIQALIHQVHGLLTHTQVTPKLDRASKVQAKGRVRQ